MSCQVTGFVVAAGITSVLSLALFKLQRQLDRITSLRLDERQGRIRAETTTVGGASASENGFTFFSIGHVESVYSKRSGTPRQPGLVSSAQSRIVLTGELKQALIGLEEFSHVWVLFLFNQNTNISKRLKARKPFDGLKLLVEPPKSKGAKVGVLSCRTPHRPNPVGLSLCRIISVDPNGSAITVAGLDCLDGTPVVDLKPYLPLVEAVESAKAPAWIYQGVDEDREVTLEWACPRRIADNGSPEEELQTLQVIEEVLSRDIRSGHQIRMGNELIGTDWEGEVVVAGIVVRYSVSRDKLVKILSLHR